LIEARLAFSAAAGRLVPQTELAGIVGVTPGAWSAWELGRNQPDLATVELLADALGVSPEWLAWGRGERYEAPQSAQDAPQTNRTAIPTTAALVPRGKAQKRGKRAG
jgi:transcriptional regulator with XRE-family HTH domain